jgi:imidazolonepropionase-like amidohydrolase
MSPSRPLSLRALLAIVFLSCSPQAALPPRITPRPNLVATSPSPDPFAEDEARARAPIESLPGSHAPPILIRHATVFTGAGPRYEPGFVLLKYGWIAAVGPGDGPTPPEGTEVIDARGQYVTPGLIDPHSHIGVYPVPKTVAHDDGNELTDPVTPSARAEDSFWPQDPAIERAVAGGVTTIGVLPGSGNLIGGRGVVLHLLPERGARAMRFPGAPEILKMACGENPKRTYREQKRAPYSRMGNLRSLRDVFIKAQKYAHEWEQWTKKQRAQAAGGESATEVSRARTSSRTPESESKPPDRDLSLETLALVMRGDILVQWHCYQADDMLSALSIADEFGFKVRAFHHALEAYKIRDILAQRGIGVATWDDWWGYKMEAYDGIPENVALLTEAGARGALHSDSPVAVQVLNQAAAKALAAGRTAGVKLDEDDAVRWLTANPAWVLGIDDQVGTLQVGKRGDVVIWSQSPLSTYARAVRVYIDGHLVFDAAHPGPPWSDFELGLRP